MNYLQIAMVLGVAVVISCIAIYSWVFICDCIVGCFKKIFHIGKKKKINWHTIDDKHESIQKEEIKDTVEEYSAHEKLY